MSVSLSDTWIEVYSIGPLAVVESLLTLSVSIPLLGWWTICARETPSEHVSKKSKVASDRTLRIRILPTRVTSSYPLGSLQGGADSGIRFDFPPLVVWDHIRHSVLVFGTTYSYTMVLVSAWTYSNRFSSSARSPCCSRRRPVCAFVPPVTTAHFMGT